VKVLSCLLWPEQCARRRLALFVLAFALTLGFAFQGARGLWEPNEGWYVPIAAAMYDGGGLLIPRLGGEPFLDKPPLNYWCMAAGMRLFGRNEFGARAYHALCFAGTVLLASLLASAFWGGREGLLAGLIYATMLAPFAAANVVTPDTPLALWVTAAFYCFWRSLAADRGQAWIWKMIFCAAMALGFLSKGPAVLVFAGAMFVYLAIQRRLAGFFVTPWAVPGFILFCAIVLPWYWAIGKKLPGGLAFMWENQVTGRLITEHYSRHPEFLGAFEVYCPMLFAGTLPWSFSWPVMLWRARGTVFRWQFIKQRPVLLFLLCWTVFPLVVFSLASSKLELYLLPAFPALALLTARGLSRFVLKQSTGIPPCLLLALGVCGVLLLGAKLGAAYLPNKKDSRAMWLAMKGHLPDGAAPILAVDIDLNGVGFYCTNPVHTVERSEPKGLFYVEPKRFEEELKTAAHSATAQAFVVARDESRLPIRAKLRAEGVRFEEYPLPFQRALLVCRPATPPPRQAN
jgi:4-amino-4-deoxy-L-arabinose transferase